MKAQAAKPWAVARSPAQTARDIFVTGLRNAHAMEMQARERMERQARGAPRGLGLVPKKRFFSIR